MKTQTRCPACNQSISLKQLLLTTTLFRFKCPHCREVIRPKSRAALLPWLLVSGVLGAGLGLWAIAGFPIQWLILIGLIGVVLIKLGASLQVLNTMELVKA